MEEEEEEEEEEEDEKEEEGVRGKQGTKNLKKKGCTIGYESISVIV